jgi:FKBP-type peptidyl-prolyl cis-trans isomerase
MKRTIFTVCASALLAAGVGAQGINPAMPAPSTPTDYSKIFKNDTEKYSYAIGMSTGGPLKQKIARADLDSDIDMLVRGFKDSFATNTALITEAQEREILGELSRNLQAKAAEKQKHVMEELRVKGEKNLVDGPAFMEKNRTQPGVVTTQNGMQYKVLVDGSGPSPKPDEDVTVNYKLSFIDGTEFDSSAKRHQPLTTKVTGGLFNFQGWTDALTMMKVGSKWQVFLPASLAYGTNSIPPVLAPNSPLIFEIELLAIRPGQTPATASPSVAQPLTSDIIKVPSQDEMKKGAKIEVIKPEDLEKEKAKASQ